MELESAMSAYGQQWVWVSMDAFTMDASKIGVPNTPANVFQQSVANLNVYSNVASLSGGGLSGNLEFWPFSYFRNNVKNIAGASGSIFDEGDERHTFGTYGSMQVHVALSDGTPMTVFAFNRWNSGGIADLGIGNNPDTSHSDWTFTENSDLYTVKTLEVWVS